VYFSSTDYIDLTVNASYALAVIKAYIGQMPQVGTRELRTVLAYERSLAEKIRKSLKDSAEASQKRLAIAAKLAPTRPAITQIHLRNPDVVVEVLIRANGSCEECKEPAPFTRKSDGTPYLEVHHRKPLAEGGEDTIENAIAMCPNCHRKAHHG
jgi:5-methylcytosine-specific restriction enzyme A